MVVGNSPRGCRGRGRVTPIGRAVAGILALERTGRLDPWSHCLQLRVRLGISIALIKVALPWPCCVRISKAVLVLILILLRLAGEVVGVTVPIHWGLAGRLLMRCH